MIKVTMTTVNVFKDRASYLVWKRAMQANFSIVDFAELEKDGKHIIKSGTNEDGSETLYTYREVANGR